MSQEVEEEERLQKFGLRIYKGVVTFKNANHQVDEIEEMETRDDDIWVCTFPRSGLINLLL
jgi:hypothetical protein